MSIFQETTALNQLFSSLFIRIKRLEMYHLVLEGLPKVRFFKIKTKLWCLLC